jgi:hypothetical protein
VKCFIMTSYETHQLDLLLLVERRARGRREVTLASGSSTRG